MCYSEFESFKQITELDLHNLENSLSISYKFHHQMTHFILNKTVFERNSINQPIHRYISHMGGSLKKEFNTFAEITI